MSNETHSVRRLGPGDRADSLALLELFGTAFGEPETYGGAIPDPAYLRRLLGREHVFVLVADAAAGLKAAMSTVENDLRSTIKGDKKY